MFLKDPVQFRESSSVRILLSALLRSPCRMVGAVLYTHIQPPASYLRRRRSKSERVAVPPVYASDCGVVLFTHEPVGALLPLSGKVSIGEMIAVETLIGPVVGEVDDGEGEAR